ncbi:hypothetical protein IW262DRAFT_1461737 [Armillaria fumosa]|nr:hypothetical protein IW262DRAFT_1461737 [Armillaria fumosa]
MLGHLNAVLGTTYTLDASIGSLLQYFIDKNGDFGIAYAYLRRMWYGNEESEYPIDLSTMKEKLCFWEAGDRKMRETVVTEVSLISRWLGHGNASRVEARGISHAWLDEKDRILIWTSMNGKEWPVPLPAGVDLRLVRIELLELGCEYVWLDVLCLRQEGGPREDLRLEEWRVDVPIIGGVYVQNQGFAPPEPVVYYLDGLGRPLGQVETNRDYIIAGETGAGPMQADARQRFKEQLSKLQGILSSSIMLPDLLSEMQTRVSTTAVDRVAGLVALSWCDEVPTYTASQTEEEAWSTLLDAMSTSSPIILLLPGSWQRPYADVATNLEAAHG